MGKKGDLKGLGSKAREDLQEKIQTIVHFMMKKNDIYLENYGAHERGLRLNIKKRFLQYKIW